MTLCSLLDKDWGLRLEFSRELFIKLGIGLESEYRDGLNVFNQGDTSKYTVDLDVGKNLVFMPT